MKTIVLAIALTVTAAPLLRAADADAKAARRNAAGAGGGLSRFGNFEELGLNEDQKAKIQEFMKENGDKLRSLREDQSTPREEKVKKFQDFQESMKGKMKEVLTAEQFEKWEKQRSAGPGAGGSREGMQKLMESLNLNSDQQEKVRAAFKEQIESMQSVRDASPDERREKMQAMQEKMSAKMKEILTADQFEKYEKAAKEMRGRLGGADGGKKKRGNN